MNSLFDRLKKILSDERFSKVKDFFDKYKNYVCVCGLFVAMLLILYFFTGEDAIADRIAKLNNKTVSGEDYVPDKEFEVDEYSEINELFATYFSAYANADFTTLEAIATPITDMEKSYISLMSQYYESFQNITCYTKHGLSNNSYIVTVCSDTKFYEQEVMAPGMLTFYVQTNEEGNLYINNLYSNFNMNYKELEVNKDVYTAFRKYATQDDYLKICNDIEESFNALIKENKDIFQIVKRTIPLVRQEWEDAVYYAEETMTEESQQPNSTEVGEPTEIPPAEAPSTETSQTPEVPPESESEEPVPTVEKVRAKGAVNIRMSTDTSSSDNIIRKSEDGEVFVKLGEENGWIKIQVDDETVGYISAEYAETVTE